MIEMKKTESGLLVPIEKPKEPERVFKPLEIAWDVNRKEAQKYFTKLLNISSIRSNWIACSDDEEKQRAKCRKQLIIGVAKQLLGDDFSYEELC